MRHLLIAVLAFGCPSPVVAQTISAGVLLETFTMAEPDELRLESLRLLTIPYAARLSLTERASLSVSGAYAEGSMGLATGESSTVAGLTDTRVSLEMSLNDFRFSASALVGTGDVVATQSEAILVGLLSADLLPFAVEQWGTGGGYAADVAYGLPFGESTLSLAVGASTTAGTEPLSSGFVYQPGMEVRGRAAFETPVGATGVASVAVGMQRFAVDTYDDRNLYRSGRRWEGAASYALAIGPRESVLLFGSLSKVAGGVSEVRLHHLDYQGFSQAVVGRPARTTLRAGMEMRLARRRATLVPRAEMRVLRREDGVGQGWIGSFGTAAEITLVQRGYRRTLVAEPTVHASIGKLRATDAIESGIVGIRAGLLLRWSGRP